MGEDRAEKKSKGSTPRRIKSDGRMRPTSKTGTHSVKREVVKGSSRSEKNPETKRRLAL